MQMKDKAIADNVIASVRQISEKVSGGPVNLKLLSLKLKSSPSIPLYLGTGLCIAITNFSHISPAILYP